MRVPELMDVLAENNMKVKLKCLTYVITTSFGIYH